MIVVTVGRGRSRHSLNNDAGMGSAIEDLHGNVVMIFFTVRVVTGFHTDNVEQIEGILSQTAVARQCVKCDECV